MAKKRKATKRRMARPKLHPAKIAINPRTGKVRIFVSQAVQRVMNPESRGRYIVHVGHYHLSSHASYKAALSTAKRVLSKIYGPDYLKQGFTPKQVITEPPSR